MRKVSLLLILAVFSLEGSIRAELVVQSGHSGRVISVAFSPDGKYLASGGQEGSLKVWEVGSGNILYDKAHGGAVHSVSFSPDGKTLASASMDDKIRFWDMNTGKLSSEKPGTTWWDERYRGTVYFSPSWKYVGIIKFSNPANWPVKCNTITELRDLSSWNLIWSYKSSYQCIDVTFSPDEKTVAMGFRGYDRVKIFETTTGKIMKELNMSYVYFVNFSLDGKILVTSDRSGRITWWDTETGEKLNDLKIVEPYNWSLQGKFTPDSKLFISGHDGSQTRFWDGKSGNKLFELDGLKVWEAGGGVSHLDISRDGKLLATAVGKAIGIWDLKDRRLVRVLAREPNALLSAEISKDGRFISFASSSGTIGLWETETGKIHLARVSSSAVNSISFSPNSELLAYGCDDGGAGILSLPGLDKVKDLTKDNWENLGVRFSPDGRFLAVSSYDNIIRIFHVQTGNIHKVLKLSPDLFSNYAYEICFSPDSRLLASSGQDSILRVWDVEFGIPIHRIKVSLDIAESPMDYDNWIFQRWLYGVEFSPDGNSIAIAQWGGWKKGYVKIYDAQTTYQRSVVTTHKPISLSYSPDGRMLASGGTDNSIRVINLGTAEETSVLVGHADFVVDLSFSSDGKYLLSAGMDGTAKVWDLKEGKFVLTLLNPENEEFLVYTPESYYRCSEGAKKYVLFAREGSTYTPSEYESKMGWKNKPERVELIQMQSKK